MRIASSASAEKRTLVALLIAEIISTTGAQITSLAVPWLVLATTGSSERAGLAMAAEIAPIALLGIPSGALAARLGARSTMLAADSTRAVLVAAVPLLYWFGALNFPILLVLVFCVGACWTPYASSQQVLLPDIGRGEQELARISSLLQAATRTTLVLGPPIAGVLIAVAGAPAALVVDAATYLISFALVARCVQRRDVRAVGNDAHGLFAGVRFLLHNRLVGLWATASSLSEASWQGLFIAMPVLAFFRFGGNARIAGLLMAAFGGGALLGTITVYRMLRSRSPLMIARFGKLVQAAAFFVLALTNNAAEFAAVVFVAGVANGMTNGPVSAVTLSRTPAAIRPKSTAASMTLSLLGGTAGLVAAGTLLGHGHAIGRLFVILGGLQAIALVLFVYGSLSDNPRMDRDVGAARPNEIPSTSR